MRRSASMSVGGLWVKAGILLIALWTFHDVPEIGENQINAGNIDQIPAHFVILQ